MNITRVRGHSFCPSGISAQSIVIDCGANHGLFSRWISENTSATVYSFEPDPRLYASLPRLPRVEALPYAVSNKAAMVRFNLGPDEASSLRFRHNSENGGTSTVQSIILEEFCRGKGILSVALLKLDIEGAELDVISSMTDEFLSRIEQMTVEFHDFIDIGDRPRIRECITKLQHLGFQMIRFSVNDYSDVLFVNQRFKKIGWIDLSWTVAVHRIAPGIKRVIRRKLGLNAVLD